MNIDNNGTSWWSNFWKSTAGKVIGTVLIVAAVVALTIITAGVSGAVTAALGGGFWAAVAGGAVGGAISGAIFGAGFSIASQGIINGYNDINWGKVGVDTLIGVASGALMGAAFAAIGRGIGLLGNAKYFQNRPNTFMFGGRSGNNMTIFKIGKGFRFEADAMRGFHLHYKTVKYGLSYHRIKLITSIWNAIVGITTYWSRQ